MALDLQDHLVLEAELVQLEAEVLLVPQEEWAQPDLQDLEEELDLLVSLDVVDRLEPLEALDLLDVQVALVSLVYLDAPVAVEQLDPLAV